MSGLHYGPPYPILPSHTTPYTVNTGPTESPTTCLDLTVQANGMISYNIGTASLKPVGTVATYTCDTGYAVTLTGGTTRTCVKGGVWSGSVPTCHRKWNKMYICILVIGVFTNTGICSDIPPLINGAIFYNGGSTTDIRPINTIATHSCNTGYTITEESVRVCQNDRTWSGSTPTCQGEDK